MANLWKRTAGKGKLTALYKALKDNEVKGHRLSQGSGGIPWLNDRIRVSTLPVSFEIPMDVRKLRGMSIKTYLCDYCKIPHERMLIYHRLYKKHKPVKTNCMTHKELPTAIHDLLYCCVPMEEVNKFLTLLTASSMGDIDVQLFAGIAATAERVLYLSFAEMAGPISPGALRSFKECADFGSLSWKIKDSGVTPALKRLLSTLG